MRGFFERIWNKFGVVNVCLLKTGVYIVQFEDLKDMAKVVDAGSWYFDNKPIIVKPLSTNVSLERDGLFSVLIWIKLPGLKFHLWVTPMLSKLTSVVVRPLYTDMMTSNRSRLDYARLCVKIGI
ncbi:hypothetical protein LguiB_028431 [Lonicera macranthoides]